MIVSLRFILPSDDKARHPNFCSSLSNVISDKELINRTTILADVYRSNSLSESEIERDKRKREILLKESIALLTARGVGRRTTAAVHTSIVVHMLTRHLSLGVLRAARRFFRGDGRRGERRAGVSGSRLLLLLVVVVGVTCSPRRRRAAAA